MSIDTLCANCGVVLTEDNAYSCDSCRAAICGPCRMTHSPICKLGSQLAAHFPKINESFWDKVPRHIMETDVIVHACYALYQQGGDMEAVLLQMVEAMFERNREQTEKLKDLYMNMPAPLIFTARNCPACGKPQLGWPENWKNDPKFPNGTRYICAECVTQRSSQ